MGLGTTLGGMAHDAGNAAGNAAHDAGNAANNAAHDAGNAAQNAAHQAGNAAQNAGNAAQDAGNQAQGQAAQLVQQCGGNAQTLANALQSMPPAVRDAALQLAHQMFGNAFVQQVIAALDGSLQHARDGAIGAANAVQSRYAHTPAIAAAVANVIAKIRATAWNEGLPLATSILVRIGRLPTDLTEAKNQVVASVCEMIGDAIQIGSMVVMHQAQRELIELQRETKQMKSQLGKLDHGVHGVIDELKHAKSHEDGEKKRAQGEEDTKERVDANLNKAASSLADIRNAVRL